MRDIRHCKHRTKHEQGIALVLGLIFLMLLTLIGTTSISVSTQQERTSGNSRDYLTALEAAEAGLRDCESILQGASVPPITNTAGLYDFIEVEDPEDGEVWQTVNWGSGTAVRVVDNENASWPGGAPRCIIEAFPPGYGAGSGNASRKAGAAIEDSGRYRVTARATGQFPSTIVLLQSTYAR